MSKVKDAKYEELKEEVEKPTIESSIVVLRTQLKDYREKAEYFKTMTLKTSTPAKSISIIPFTGDADGVITLNLKIKGTYGDDIVMLFDDFPLTIDNILVDRIKIKTADSSTDEIFKVLSFH